MAPNTNAHLNAGCGQLGSLGGDPFRAFVLTPTEGCVADLNNDGMLDPFDISLFLQAYQPGCP